jgi:hypothetical protein
MYHIRGKDVMSDNDVAIFLSVDIGTVWDIMKRRSDSFKSDSFFEIAPEELQDWADQFVSIPGEAVIYKPVYFFTEFGIFMLSIFLDSKVSRQFALMIGDVLFKPRKLDDETIVSREIEKMNKNETLKALWAVYRENKVMQTSWKEKPEN